MSETNTTRRTGRDRRDAGSYRRIRVEDRERDLARSEARELKGRGLAWNCVVYAAPSRLAVPMRLDFDAKRSVEAFGHVSVPDGRDAPPPRPAEGVAATAGEAAPSPDRSWLPEVGAPVVVAGVRIAAFEVAGGCDHPFYVLARAE